MISQVRACKVITTALALTQAAADAAGASSTAALETILSSNGLSIEDLLDGSTSIDCLELFLQDYPQARQLQPVCQSLVVTPAAAPSHGSTYSLQMQQQ
jgi:hypothetical protein